MRLCKFIPLQNFSQNPRCFYLLQLQHMCAPLCAPKARANRQTMVNHGSWNSKNIDLNILPFSLTNVFPHLPGK